MRTFKTVVGVAVLALCGSWLLSGSAGHASRSVTSDGPPALRDSSIWSATTYEAASKDANKMVLSHGRKATITGEVVDVSCYLQLGKRGAAHLECGSKCVANGQPMGILDKDDNLYILFAEEHHPRRDGQVDLKSKFAPLLTRTITVPGTVSKMRGYSALFVKADAVLDTVAAR